MKKPTLQQARENLLRLKREGKVDQVTTLLRSLQETTPMPTLTEAQQLEFLRLLARELAEEHKHLIKLAPPNKLTEANATFILGLFLGYSARAKTIIQDTSP